MFVTPRQAPLPLIRALLASRVAIVLIARQSVKRLRSRAFNAFTLPIFWLVLLALVGLAAPSADAMTFNLTFDASTNSAPAGFLSAFNYAISFYETNFTDPITMNMNVGWGEVNGVNVPPGTLGQSSAIQPGFFHFDTMKTALINDAKSASDLKSVNYMPSSDPTGNATFKLSRAESRALGIMAGDGAGQDGSVGFNSGEAYTFDPNHRAVPGKVDFIGVAEHEISEVLGRFGLGQNGAPSGRYSPIDFFRYTAPGALDLVPTNGAYFSIDGGATVINTFNGTGGGDLSDWSGATVDSYDASLATGVELPVSPGDMIVMDVIGYDRLLPGDLNRDGQVTVADIQSLMAALSDLSGYQSAKGLSPQQLLLVADLDGNGHVTNADIQALIALLANTSGAGSLTAVPEPSAIVLAFVAIAGASHIRALHCNRAGVRKSL